MTAHHVLLHLQARSGSRLAAAPEPSTARGQQQTCRLSISDAASARQPVASVQQTSHHIAAVDQRNSALDAQVPAATCYAAVLQSRHRSSSKILSICFMCTAPSVDDMLCTKTAGRFPRVGLTWLKAQSCLGLGSLRHSMINRVTAVVANRSKSHTMVEVRAWQVDDSAFDRSGLLRPSHTNTATADAERPASGSEPAADGELAGACSELD